MKSILFASTLAAALTATSFGQVEVELLADCCGPWEHTYVDQVLTFTTEDNSGATLWTIQVPEDTRVSFALSMLDTNIPPDAAGGIFEPFQSLITEWSIQGEPSFWTGTFTLPAGLWEGAFYEFKGTIDFGYELETQGSCCVNSGCSSTDETTCTELGGTWTEGGSCDDCEPVAGDCPADVDGDGTIGFSDVLIILNDWGACP